MELINPKLGLYIEEVAELQISTTEWKISTRINLNFLRDEYKNIKAAVDNLKTHCNNSNKNFKAILDYEILL